MEKLKFYENVRVITDAINNQKIDRVVLDLLKKKPYYDYFFQEVKAPIWFETLKKEGFFNPSNAPKPTKVKDGYRMPLWSILPYLVEVARSTRKKENEKYIKDLLDLIRDVTRTSSGELTRNYITARYFVSILAELPNDSISVSDIHLIPFWFLTPFDTSVVTAEIMEKLIPKFLSDEATEEDIWKAEMIILQAMQPVPLSAKGAHPLREGYKRAMGDLYWIADRLIEKKYATKIGKICHEAFIFSLASILEQVITDRYPEHEHNNDFSYIWFDLFDNAEKANADNLEETIARVLRETLDAKAESDTEQTITILKSFLVKKYPIFTRYVIFIINKYWDNYKNLVDELLLIKKENLFNDGNYERDLFELFNNHIVNFTSVQKRKIKELIASGPNYKIEKDNEKHTAYWKQEWYKMMSKDEDFARLYEECKQITHTEVPDKKQVENFSWVERHTDENKLKADIEQSPGIFTEKKSEYLSLPFESTTSIFFGLRDAWDKGNDIPWDDILNFASNYLSSDNRKKLKTNDDEWGKARYVLSALAQLIESGAKEDKCMPIALLKKAQLVLFNNITLLKDNTEEELSEDHGYVFHANNTAYGTTISALFHIAYLLKNLDKKNQTNEFDANWKLIRDNYELLFGEDVIDMYVLFGRYLPWFYHVLDKSWTKNMIKRISPDSTKKEWVAFMEGYLFNSQVNNEIFVLLMNHYLTAFNYEFKEKQLNTRLLQNVCIGYLWNFKEEKKSIGKTLFNKIIKKSTSKQKESIIDFIWQQRDVPTNVKDIIWPGIKDFWRKMYISYKAKPELTDEDKKVVSGLSKYMTFLSQIDATTFEWLSFSVPYAYLGYDEAFVLEYLDKLKDKGVNQDQKKLSALFVGALYVHLLRDVEFPPSFDRKHIDSIINYLYSFGDKEVKELADLICNIYGLKGSYILKEAWDKNNFNYSLLDLTIKKS